MGLEPHEIDLDGLPRTIGGGLKREPVEELLRRVQWEYSQLYYEHKRLKESGVQPAPEPQPPAPHAGSSGAAAAAPRRRRRPGRAGRQTSTPGGRRGWLGRPRLRAQGLARAPGIRPARVRPHAEEGSRAHHAHGARVRANETEPRHGARRARRNAWRDPRADAGHPRVARTGDVSAELSRRSTPSTPLRSWRHPARSRSSASFARPRRPVEVAAAEPEAHVGADHPEFEAAS